MKEHHKKSFKTDAIAILTRLKIHIGQDFHTLSSKQVDAILDEANRAKYLKMQMDHAQGIFTIVCNVMRI